MAKADNELFQQIREKISIFIEQTEQIEAVLCLLKSMKMYEIRG